VCVACVVTLPGCGGGAQQTGGNANTISAPPGDLPGQRLVDERVADAEHNAERNASGASARTGGAEPPPLDTPNPNAHATDRTTLGPDGLPEDSAGHAPDRAERRPRTLLSSADLRSFQRLEAQLGAQAAIGVSVVGTGRTVRTAGSFSSGPAWSTIKVPISLAVLDQAGGAPSASQRALMMAAIGASDNAAAERLWAELGSPAAAGGKVETVLGQAGDTSTRVQTQVTRGEFSAYGQTDWSIVEQTRFAAALPCLPHGDTVLDLMGQVRSDQRWGLGSAGAQAAQFKGGWGPDPSGRYLARQMGVLRVDGRLIAATVAVIPADGSFASATSDLTRIASWLVERVNTSAASSRPRC